MPKHWRQCSFCSKNNFNFPHITIFGLKDATRKSLRVQSTEELLICEEHFLDDDIKVHGNSKRLKEGAIPSHIPFQDYINNEHSYVPTIPLNLVSLKNFKWCLIYINA